MILLIGPGGAGKTTVGAALAVRLNRPFHDLDREFEDRRAGIDRFISMYGYAAYARENVAVCLEVIPHVGAAILALSSGFMVYAPSVHPAYDALKQTITHSHTTFVLLPALDRDICVAETVRRQLGRPFGRRDAAREEAVIQDRFGRYLALTAPKVETMRPVHEVVEAIHVQLGEANS